MAPKPLIKFDTGVASHAGASFFCEQLALLQLAPTGRRLRILVAGSGEGHEAEYIQRQLSARVCAIDLNFSPAREFDDLPHLAFMYGSVENLPYREQVFDAVFYHHVIEHVENPAASLREIARVLTSSGIMFIGTPNRNRAFSALGSQDNPHWESTILNKCRANLDDWKARLQGRFRNELGAHAGFTLSELDTIMSPLFAKRRWLTREYLLHKYRGHYLESVVKIAATRPLINVTAPSIYALCAKA